MGQVQGYLALDHGTCPVKGSTEPTKVETQFISSKVFVPTKCATCRHMTLDKFRGFVCKIDGAAWGEFPRTLDWGSWSPDHPNLGLASGRSVSHAVLNAVVEGNEVQAIRAFRESHPDATVREARDAFAELTAKFGQGT